MTEQAGKVLWRYGKGTPYVPSPLLAGRSALLSRRPTARCLTSLDLKTGKAVLDSERLPGPEELLRFADRRRRPHLPGGSRRHDAGAEQGDKLEVLATNRLDDPIDASPALVGKQLFLRGEKYLYCIEGK